MLSIVILLVFISNSNSLLDPNQDPDHGSRLVLTAILTDMSIHQLAIFLLHQSGWKWLWSDP